MYNVFNSEAKQHDRSKKKLKKSLHVCTFIKLSYGFVWGQTDV